VWSNDVGLLMTLQHGGRNINRSVGKRKFCGYHGRRVSAGQSHEALRDYASRCSHVCACNGIYTASSDIDDIDSITHNRAHH